MPQSRLNFHLPFTVQVHLCIEAIRICSGWVGLTDTVPHRMSFISGFRNVLKRVCMYVWGIHRCSHFFSFPALFWGLKQLSRWELQNFPKNSAPVTCVEYSLCFCWCRYYGLLVLDYTDTVCWYGG